MTKIRGHKISILLVIITVLVSVCACGGGGDSSPESGDQQVTPSVTDSSLESAQAQLITSIGEADSADERKAAIEAVVQQGFTLGLVDENRNQLNPNLAADSLSLTPEDVAAHTAMIPGGNYRTINYGVILWPKREWCLLPLVKR